MIAAGVEGGSKRAVEDEWGLGDVEAQRSHWRRFGPPTHVAVAIFAAAWGVKLISDEPEQAGADEPTLQVNGPTIAELAASLPQMAPGGETLAASLAVARMMKGA